MISHFLWLVVFAALVSTVFGVLLRDRPRDQLLVGLRLFAALVGVAFVLGWLMYPFPI